MSVFTDDDMKRLKEDCETWQRSEDDQFFEVTVSPSQMQALLARLEAAEDYIGHLQTCDGCNDGEEYKAWRKSKGESND